MNWKLLIQDILATDMKRSEIANHIGVNASTITEILSGEIKDMYWRKGDALIRLHAERCQKKAA
jgi:predicted XRE-type DNA-binding protein